MNSPLSRGLFCTSVTGEGLPRTPLSRGLFCTSITGEGPPSTPWLFKTCNTCLRQAGAYPLQSGPPGIASSVAPLGGVTLRG